MAEFFVWSWGYDQTNIDYYQVVKRTPKCVWVRRVHKRTLDTPSSEGYHDLVVPIPDAWRQDEEPIRRTVRHYDWDTQDREWITIADWAYSSAHTWNGEPCSQTNSAYGH